MQVVVAVVGRARDQALGDAARAYEARAARYWPLSVVEVKEERGAATADAARTREGARLLAAVPAGAHLVACDPAGRAMDSPAFAAWLRRLRDDARSVCFAIGGAYGLSDAVREAAATRLAFGPWTLPHELARVVLAEQLYRAGTIARGEPYHK